MAASAKSARGEGVARRDGVELCSFANCAHARDPCLDACLRLTSGHVHAGATRHAGQVALQVLLVLHEGLLLVLLLLHARQRLRRVAAASVLRVRHGVVVAKAHVRARRRHRLLALLLQQVVVLLLLRLQRRRGQQHRGVQPAGHVLLRMRAAAALHAAVLLEQLRRLHAALPAEAQRALRLHHGEARHHAASVLLLLLHDQLLLLLELLLLLLLGQRPAALSGEGRGRADSGAGAGAVVLLLLLLLRRLGRRLIRAVLLLLLLLLLGAPGRPGTPASRIVSVWGANGRSSGSRDAPTPRLGSPRARARGPHGAMRQAGPGPRLRPAAPSAA